MNAPLQHTHAKRRRRRTQRLRYLYLVGLPAAACLALFAFAAWVMLVPVETPPRNLAYAVEQRLAGKPALLAHAINPVLDWLALRDSIAPAAWEEGAEQRDKWVKAREEAMAQPPVSPEEGAREYLVGDALQVEQAFERARPGDVITLLPGEYRFERTIGPTHGGSADRPITMQSRNRGSVKMFFTSEEAILVEQPGWRFFNLVMQGVCSEHKACEHGFHVSGPARHFEAAGNVLLDFNAHFKVNGLDGHFPDHGVIRHNVIRNTMIRSTDVSVNLVDIVAASHWTVAHNVVADFVKSAGNRVTFGIFAKGAGSDNRIESNIVLCHDHLGSLGQEVGISLGGGGTGKPYCRDRRCLFEQENSTIAGNLIIACSDAGIYLNRASSSRVLHNSLIDTAGIDLRFAETLAEVRGNLVDGPIRVREGAQLDAEENLSTPALQLYFGRHPARELFAEPAALDLRWTGEPPRAHQAVELDLCGTQRTARPAFGAFDDFAGCRLDKTAEARASGP